MKIIVLCCFLMIEIRYEALTKNEFEIFPNFLYPLLY
jgi:hypothetical protein